MAVVINDMEVSPQPASGEQQSHGGGESSPKDNMKQVEKTLRKKRERSYRLEAY